MFTGGCEKIGRGAQGDCFLVSLNDQQYVEKRLNFVETTDAGRKRTLHEVESVLPSQKKTKSPPPYVSRLQAKRGRPLVDKVENKEEYNTDGMW